MKKYLERIGEISIESTKVHVVHYGFDFSNHVGGRNDKIEHYGQTVRPFTVGTVCRLTPQKDIFTLFDSFSIVLQQRRDARLKIVGVGELETELKNYAESIGISQSVDWLGSQADPYGAMGVVDLFVLSSRYEGFGLVVLEWISKEKPIVASRIPPLEEILGRNYPLFCEVGNANDFARKILRVSMENYVFNELKRYNRIRNNFEIRKMGIKINEVYRNTSINY